MNFVLSVPNSKLSKNIYIFFFFYYGQDFFLFFLFDKYVGKVRAESTAYYLVNKQISHFFFTDSFMNHCDTTDLEWS